MSEESPSKSMSLIQLIYVSTATRECDAEDIRQILDASARHNSPQQVTGLLLYVGGTFMQVLEGEEAAVDETMTRIRSDTRHHDIIVLARSGIRVREFGKWWMGFRGVSAADVEAMPNYAPFFQYGFNHQAIAESPGLALAILKMFASQN